jgi:methylenetetrahydrofolate dehydrogenase (NADP+)/methenyltetrahydrofolate cyclohydrolase
MTARRIDGKAIARRIEESTAQATRRIRDEHGSTVRLDVVLVGDDEASAAYVQRKTRAAERVGIQAKVHRLAADARDDDVAALLAGLEADDDVNGILLQLPLPDGLDTARILEALGPRKDVDCFHPENLGLALLGRALMPPPTPQAVLEILANQGVQLRGAEAVVVNHSNLIGKPLAALLLNEDATVSVCHKHTKDLVRHTRRADVLVSGTGVAGLITKAHVKPGAVVIDVGFSRTADGLPTGDLDQAAVAAVASAFTPVPGGVGPVTVAMVLQNTVTAWRLQHSEVARVP